MTDNKKLLIYGIKGERLDGFERISFSYGYEIREIKDFELDFKVKDLLANTSNERPNDFVFDDEFGQDFEYMLLVNIHDEELYNFLEELKANGIYIPHKAVLTKTNINWPLRHLMKENMEEHKVMSVYGQLRRILPVGHSLVEKTDDKLLKEILVEAEDYFHPREFEFEELRDIYNKLASRINELLDQDRN